MKSVAISSAPKWWFIFILGYGAFVFLPFLAPVLMHWNLEGLGKSIYFLYGFVCHQLPERSLFFFGSKSMYSLSEIQAVWQKTDNPLILRQFVGTPEMGWKVAWSDRMISMYGGVWVAGLLWGLWKRFIPKFSVWNFIVLAFPMLLDGITHLISDLGGLAEGFRYTNHWLVVLTHNYFPASFYVGDALGSFNSLARWVTGVLFAFGLVCWVFPYIDEIPNEGIQAALIVNPRLKEN